MRVDNDFCFDPTTQSECHRQPKFLQPGQAVFFAVLPNFMNVDIRIVLDVTVGITDVYLTPDPKMFIVKTNKTTWDHEIVTDTNFRLYDNTVSKEHLVCTISFISLLVTTQIFFALFLHFLGHYGQYRS